MFTFSSRCINDDTIESSFYSGVSVLVHAGECKSDFSSVVTLDMTLNVLNFYSVVNAPRLSLDRLRQSHRFQQTVCSPIPEVCVQDKAKWLATDSIHNKQMF